MYHLTARVAWHDNRWNGAVCKHPSGNPYCVALDRVRESRNEEKEDTLTEKSFGDLTLEQLPPCKAEGGAFMNATEWRRTFQHPYADVKKTKSTHGALKPTTVKVPPYSTFVVPFNWMLRSEQDRIDESLPEPLPPDEDAPFENTPWVFGKERQKALTELFFGRLQEERSIVFFYCKEGQPLGDRFNRLVVGVGTILKIGNLEQYGANGKPSYALWDRLIRHSIRPDKAEGFILPYHDYLEPTGDAEEDERRMSLLEEIAVPVDQAHMRAYSYAGELAAPDVALSTLVHCLEAVRRIKAHGIAKGPWDEREAWLNERIAEAWQDRGAFPGLGPVLEAMDMPLGTALALDLVSSGMLRHNDDPWLMIDSLFKGEVEPPKQAYAAHFKALKKTWERLSGERRALAQLLSRFSLTAVQAKRWFHPTERKKCTSVTVSDDEILKNPYRICETDLGGSGDAPISLGTIDRGMLPDNTIAVRHPVPEPSKITSHLDPRRVRAALVAALRIAALNGDTLLSIAEAGLRVAKMDLTYPCAFSEDWVNANEEVLDGVVKAVPLLVDEDGEHEVTALQLEELHEREAALRKVLERRALKAIDRPDEDWDALLKQAIKNSGGRFDPNDTKHQEALHEQANALRHVTGRKLTVLVGKAGTGKTSVMGAVMLSNEIARGGILLLAPTGKARVRLGNATSSAAMTIAQFLHQNGRYDGIRQRPLFTGAEKYRKERTVVIDECSMLTMDDLFAVLEALDLVHVQRIILVGDPNQLPPIGVGRPFADLVSHLDTTQHQDDEGNRLADALARLSVVVRAAAQAGGSDTLRLASWYTREPQAVDADRVLSDLEAGKPFNDLQIRYWKTAEELHKQLDDAFTEHLGMSLVGDVDGFNASLGFKPNGFLDFADPSGSEKWQILSPVRMQMHGVQELNRWVQKRYRARELQNATTYWDPSLGDENIVNHDKVILTENKERGAYNWRDRKPERHYVANGEVGLIVKPNKRLAVAFAGRNNLTFDFRAGEFSERTAPLQLAYALTVHKSQGSEFGKVFVVLPAKTRLLTKELVYTALTRSKQQLVLFIEGKDGSYLFDLTKPERSETARRNTNLFVASVRPSDDEVPFARNLIHKTMKGHLVRSKSELVIANMLYQKNVVYEYERICEGTEAEGRLRPDFSFVTPDGELIVWEHLGMMSREDYRRGWDWKNDWYTKNGFKLGKNLFTSEDDDRGALDSDKILHIINQIEEQL
ncbi:MAG: hypothetical protein FGM32_08125 [Candidatus Kapabacteria bacterium]|nr:hypothetical protein [Candidatus Kapabacteria bacterium]